MKSVANASQELMENWSVGYWGVKMGSL